MGIFLGSDEGLMLLQDTWTLIDCPLHQVTHAACTDGAIAALDDSQHLLWLSGHLLSCDRDVEALQLWQGHALVLSSDTDCLSIADKDGWLVTTRIGMYPQDMCITGDTVCICGGADGLVHLLTLPELHTMATFPVPGQAQRIHVAGQTAYVLCAAESDGLRCRLCRLDLSDGRCRPLSELPGLAGAVRMDVNGVWVAASETLVHFPFDHSSPDCVFGGFGLIRHIDVQGSYALITDPVAELCALVTLSPEPEAAVLRHGMTGQAGFF
ncbi:MAG: hypothetical protein IJZ74_10840 [Clostridia bacterium]|nr:hypothetical protein [Clostridia bacterium]